MFLYPSCFIGLYGVLKEKPKKEYLLIFGSIGLILTHTVLTMYVAIICFIYLLTQIKKIKNKKMIKKIILSLLFIILITSFFWVPLLEHKLLANYEVFKKSRMERTDVLIALKLSFSELFFTPKENVMIYEIGLLSVLLLIASPIVIKKLKGKYKKTDFYHFYLFSLVAGIVCCIMTLNIFPFEKLPSILKMLQFSYRMLEFSSFFFAFVVAVNLEILWKKVKYKDVFFTIVILMLLTCFFIPHLHFRETAEEIDENRLWPAVSVTNKTGRVHAGCASFEYLPCRAFENRSYIETRSDEIIVLEGNTQIKEQIKQNVNLSCKLSDVLEETKLELPYIYYLGYKVTLKQNKEVVTLKTYETENGFVGITIPTLKEATLEVNYEGTMLMKISLGISILAIVLLFIRAIIRK